MALRAELEQLLAQLGEVAARVAGPGLVQHDLVRRRRRVGDLVRRDVAARELGAAHQVEHPAHLLAGDHRREGLAADLADDLRRTCGARRVEDVGTGPLPGSVTSTSPERVRAVGFTTTVAPAGASTCAASACTASRVRPSPIWRASA